MRLVQPRGGGQEHLVPLLGQKDVEGIAANYWFPALQQEIGHYSNHMLG